MNTTNTHIAILSKNTFERIGVINTIKDIGVDINIIQHTDFDDLLYSVSKYKIDHLFINESFLNKNNIEQLRELSSVSDNIKTIVLCNDKICECKNPVTHALCVNDNAEVLANYISELFDSKISEENNNGLSDREIEILRLVALGKTNKEISDELFISMHTVITHRKNITAKLGIKTISGLTVYAIINKIISTNELSL